GHLTAMTQLETLWLYDMPNSTAEAAQLNRLPALKNLSLSGRGVSDQSLQYLGAMTRLRSLSIGRSGITSVGISHLKTMTGLTELATGEIAIDAEVAKQLKQIPGLRNLILESSDVPTPAELTWLQQQLPGVIIS